MPSTPIDFHYNIGSVTESVVELKWRSAECGKNVEEAYVIKYRPQQSSEWKFIVTASVASTSFSLSSLKDGSVYEACISAKNTFGESECSYTILFTTRSTGSSKLITLDS